MDNLLFAFPRTVHQEHDMINGNIFPQRGLTKREWFAGLALQGILASYSNQENIADADACALEAFARADAMIRLLEWVEKK